MSIIYSICFAYVLVNVLQWHILLNIITGKNFNRKPFNCEVCLSGWICFFINIFTDSLYNSTGMMCMAMVGMILLTGLIRRL
jgi:hypothetical protein